MDLLNITTKTNNTQKTNQPRLLFSAKGTKNFNILLCLFHFQQTSCG